MSLVLLVTGLLTPREGSAQASAAPAPLVWRRDGGRILGIHGSVAYEWERGTDGANTIRGTSLRAGDPGTVWRLEGAPYVGEPRALMSLPSGLIGHWDGLASVRTSSVMTVGSPTAAYSSAVPSGADSLVVASASEVALLRGTDLSAVWRTPLPPGAQPPELHPTGSSVGLVFQQYDPGAPTPRLVIPHRVRSLSVTTGIERWTLDFHQHLGAVHVIDDTIVLAEGADVVFMDGASGAELRRHRGLGAPNIYPAIASSAASVYVAVDDVVRAYGHAGASQWQTRVPGAAQGVRLATWGDVVFVTAGDGSVVGLRARDGAVLWRIGTGIAHGRLHATPSGLLVEGAGAWAGIPFPVPPIHPAQAWIEGLVTQASCSPIEVSVSDGATTVRVDAQGRFRLPIRAVGFVQVQASTSGSFTERPAPCLGSSAVVELDGRPTYAVALRVCCE